MINRIQNVENHELNYVFAIVQCNEKYDDSWGVSKQKNAINVNSKRFLQTIYQSRISHFNDLF